MSQSPTPALSELLDLLRQEGFAIGVDDHLRVGKLLALEVAWSEDQLRSAIRSIIAKDVQERAAFDAVWMRLFVSKLPVTSRKEFPLAVPARRSQRSFAGRLLTGLLAALAIGLVVASIGWWRWPAVRPAAPDAGVASGSVQSAAPIDAPTMDVSMVAVTGAPGASNAGSPGEKPQNGEPREPVARGSASESSKPSVSGDASVTASPAVGVTVSESTGTGSDAVIAGSGGTQLSGTGSDAVIAGSGETQLSDDQPREPAARPGYEALGVLLVGGALLASGIAMSRRLARRRQQFVPGPWRYSLRVPDAGRPVLGRNDIEEGAVHLTWQVEQEVRGDIDVDRSIHATAAAAGAPAIMYRHPRAAPRFVVLQDTEGSERWGFLYDELLRGLAHEGVEITRYTFTGDPTWCTNIDGGVPRELRELVEYCDALIVIGDGDAVLDPIEGTPAAWLELLRRVPRRLWINPVPEAKWSAGAQAIARDTRMEHGIARCLAALHLAPVGCDRGAIPSFPSAIERAPATSIGFAALRDYLGSAGLRALAAVAMAGASSIAVLRWVVEYCRLDLDEATWLRVTALPWFRFGAWPEGLQARLVTWLQTTDVAFADSVARAAAVLLVQDEPPLGSAAHLRWELDLAAARARAGDRASAGAASRKIAATALHKEIAGRLSLPSPDRALWSIRVLAALGFVLCVIGGALLLISNRDLPSPAKPTKRDLRSADAQVLEPNRDRDPEESTDRAVIDRAYLEPSSVGGYRLRVYVSALSLDGKLLDLSEPKSIKLMAGKSEIRAPYARGTFAATDTALAIVFVIKVTTEYADVIPAITEAANDEFLAALPESRTQVAIVTYAESVGSAKLGSLKAARVRLAGLSREGYAAGPVLLDALDRALRLLKTARTDPPGRPLRKMIVVVSDGRDPSSSDRDRVTTLGKRAGAAGVRIHSFAYSPDDVRGPLLLLGELSKRSFGTFRWLRKDSRAGSWRSRFAELRDEVRQQKVLTYFLDEDIAGRWLSLRTTGRTALTSLNVLKVPAAACHGEFCETGDYCAESCTHVRLVGSGLGWIVLVAGIALGATLVLGAIGFATTKRPIGPGRFTSMRRRWLISRSGFRR